MKDWTAIRKSLGRGSYSVEAALVMPIVLFVIIALCYMAFYQHDKIRIQSVMNEAVLKGSFYIRHESDLKTGQIQYERLGERGIFYFIQNHKEEAEQLEEFLQEQLKEGLFITKVEEVQVEADGLHIQAEVTSGIHFPFHTVRSYFSGQTKMKNIVKITPHNSAEFVRGYTAIDGTVGKTQWYGQIKDKLSALMKILK